jgi:hypothetical protein
MYNPPAWAGPVQIQTRLPPEIRTPSASIHNFISAGPLPPWRPAAALQRFGQSKEIIRFLCDDLAHIAHTPFGFPFIYFYVG